MQRQPLSNTLSDSQVIDVVIDLLVAGCVELEDDDGEKYVERSVDVGEDPEFFSVYAQGADRIWSCLDDFDELPLALDAATQVARDTGFAGPIRVK